jgi:hypothetical protein
MTSKPITKRKRTLKLKQVWSLTAEIQTAMKWAKANPDCDVILGLPTPQYKEVAESVLNQMSILDEAACRVQIELTTLH